MFKTVIVSRSFLIGDVFCDPEPTAETPHKIANILTNVLLCRLSEDLAAVNIGSSS
jgi:hypothetical protein